MGDLKPYVRSSRDPNNSSFLSSRTGGIGDPERKYGGLEFRAVYAGGILLSCVYVLSVVPDTIDDTSVLTQILNGRASFAFVVVDVYPNRERLNLLDVPDPDPRVLSEPVAEECFAAEISYSSVCPRRLSLALLRLLASTKKSAAIRTTNAIAPKVPPMTALALTLVVFVCEYEEEAELLLTEANIVPDSASAGIQTSVGPVL